MKIYALFAFATVAFGCGCSSNQNDAPPALSAEALREAKKNQESDAAIIQTLFSGVVEAEVVAVNPHINNAQDLRVVLRDGQTIQTLGTAIAAAVKKSDGSGSGCWNPRHGIWLNKGTRRVLVIICFECGVGRIEESGEIRMFSITRDAEKTFDAVFRRLGLKKVR